MPQLMRDAKTRRKTYLLLAIVALPVLAYFAFFFAFTLNVPYWDDYAVLAFVINFTNPEWPGKAALFFSQHNEHRIVTLRTLALGFRALSLEINWTIIAFLGNLGLLGIVWILWKWAVRSFAGPPLLRGLAFAPVVFILFQPQHHELMLWAICAFTNVGAALFAFLSFFLLTRPGGSGSPPAPALAAAFGAALLSVFTNGNGLFVLPIGALVLLAARKPVRLAAWSGAAVLAAGFYFLGYARNPVHPEIMPFLTKHPLEVLKYFLSVLGSAADFGVLRSFVPIAAGAAILAATTALAVKRFERKDPFLASGLLFVVFSLAAQALTRAPLGTAQALESRYRFLSALAIALTYLGWVRIARPGKTIAVGAIALAIGFSAASFLVNRSPGREIRTRRLANLLEWNQGKAALAYPDPGHADTIMRLAVRRKIYEPPRRWNIDRPGYPFGGITTPEPPKGAPGSKIRSISGWALDDTGPPDIIVRRSLLPSDPPAAIDRANQVAIGEVACREGTVKPIGRVYFGFPGRDRMIWEFTSAEEGMYPDDAKPMLYFFARDRDGHETLLGERQR